MEETYEMQVKHNREEAKNI